MSGLRCNYKTGIAPTLCWRDLLGSFCREYKFMIALIALNWKSPELDA